MLKDLSILKTATSLARHAVRRQALIAENIANADTPGYKAKDLEPFTEAFKRSGGRADDFRKIDIGGDSTRKPNGNTVSLEDQMQRSAVSARDHDTAMALYGKSLSILRASLGRR